jgi:hypothetical protein
VFEDRGHVQGVRQKLIDEAGVVEIPYRKFVSEHHSLLLSEKLSSSATVRFNIPVLETSTPENSRSSSLPRFGYNFVMHYCHLVHADDNSLMTYPTRACLEWREMSGSRLNYKDNQHHVIADLPSVTFQPNLYGAHSKWAVTVAILEIPISHGFVRMRTSMGTINGGDAYMRTTAGSVIILSVFALAVLTTLAFNSHASGFIMQQPYRPLPTAIPWLL